MIGLDNTTRVIGNKLQLGFAWKGDPTDPIVGKDLTTLFQIMNSVKEQTLALLKLYPHVNCIQYDPKEEARKRTTNQRELLYKRLLFQWKPYGYIVDVPGQLLEFYWSPDSNPRS